MYADCELYIFNSTDTNNKKKYIINFIIKLKTFYCTCWRLKLPQMEADNFVYLWYSSCSISGAKNY